MEDGVPFLAEAQGQGVEGGSGCRGTHEGFFPERGQESRIEDEDLRWRDRGRLSDRRARSFLQIDFAAVARGILLREATEDWWEAEGLPSCT